MSQEPDAARVVALPTGEVVADVSVPLGKPNRKTVSFVWMVIVCSNAAVMVAAALALCYGLFVAQRPALVEPGIALALFTTPAAFLAGLVARDPGQHS